MTDTITVQQAAALDALPAVIEARDRLPKFSQAVEAIVIRTRDDRQAAVEVEGQLDADIKAIEANRVAYKAPLLALGKRIDDDAKKAKEPLVALQSVIRQKVGKFDADEQAKIDKENARQAELAAKRQKAEDDRLALKAAQLEEQGLDPADILPEPSVPVIPMVPQAEATTRLASGGAVNVRKAWQVEVVDARLVPAAYCSPDLVKLRAAVKLGEREIPGCRVFEQPVWTHKS